MSERTSVICAMPAMLAAALACPAAAATAPMAVTAVAPVRLVADDWCPQHCEGDTLRKGYIVDIVGHAPRLPEGSGLWRP
ncbi:hypothetical protein [Massilia sp. TWP1-3-3]|uniref:hypothetical protein n=1 Tax=Massilia sp. TWP1-3-3 TaxID=2804573 RepID=UPI003CF0FA49